MKPVADLIDFYSRWSELRVVAVDLLKKPDLSNTEKTIIGWLIKLADRVGRRDIIS